MHRPARKSWSSGVSMNVEAVAKSLCDAQVVHPLQVVGHNLEVPGKLEDSEDA